LLNYFAGQDTPAWTPAGAAAERRRALEMLEKSLSGGQLQQAQASLGSLVDFMRAVDVAWDTLALVMTAAQRWVSAAAREAMETGLIARPGDVLFLELEELKQVATGEWHAGDRAAVQAAVAERMQEVETAPAGTSAVSPTVICPGPCDGPLYCDSPRETMAPPGAAWLAESADPGCAPFWTFAGCLMTTDADPWSPGMIAARGLGVPAIAGASVLAA
jgi:hypothetical protein